METSSHYSDSILNKLAASYPKTCTLEELTALVIPPYNVMRTFAQNIAAQRDNQAKILDALITLEHQGYIILNEATDESCITVKGLIKINHAVLRN